MKRVQKILPNALEDELVKLGKAQSLFKRWEEVVGPMLAKRSWPDRYDKGVVWVAVQGSAWAQELRLMKETILKRLRSMAGSGDMFRDVRFGVRPLPERPPADAERESEPEKEELSIREIAQRRLKQWQRDDGSV